MPYPTNPKPSDLNEQLATTEIFDAFNKKAKTGIALIKKACSDLGLDETQQRSQIAAFLLEHQANLNGEQVFDYATTGDAENAEVLKSFAAQFGNQMAGQEFVPALRGFVQALPLAGGEAQKIDRYVKAFAEEYARRNPTKLANSDAAYTMAFSTVMLNTDAHSNQVENKMTLQQFLNNNRGMNNGQDFDQDFLKAIYADIKQNELKLKPREVEASYTLAPANLKNDALLSSITKELGKNTPNLKAAIGVDGAQATISNKKPWYGFLTGYKSTVTITKDGNQVTLEVSNPGLFSKNKQPSVVLKPTPGEGGAISQGSIDLAAQVVAKFETPGVAKSPYPYQQKNMERAVDSENLKAAPINKAFEKYAENTGHSAELSFLKEVESLKEGIANGKHVSELQVQAFGIQQRYLVPSADFPVRIDHKATEEIDGKLQEILDLDEKGLHTLFDDAAAEVKEKLQSGPMQNFKQTGEFQQQKKSVSEAAHLEKKLPGKENSQKQSVKQSL